MRTSLSAGIRLRIDEQVNPMESVINIVDAFLVCMVGVLAMLVVFYKVDLGGQEVVKSRSSEVSTIQNDPSVANDKAKYQKMGTVYVDKETGKMYVVTEEEGPR